MKKTRLLLLSSLLTLSYGCATPVLIGGAAVGGYYVGKDERKVKTIATDASITAHINGQLFGEKGISSTDIDVDTYKGVVYLYGHVPNREVERRVIEIAESAEGVTKVVSKLALTGR